jgi:hypothetical protein
MIESFVNSFHKHLRRVSRPKKGSVVSLLVSLVFLALSVVAVAWIVYKVLVITGAIVPEAQCEWSVLVVAISKFGTAGLLDLPPECKTNYHTVTLEEVQAKLPEAQLEISKIQKAVAIDSAQGKAYSEIAGIFRSGSEPLEYEWALNSIMAAHLKSCWRKTFEGKTPIFDSWYNVVDWELFGLNADEEPKDNKQALELYRSDILSYFGVKSSLFKTYGPPTFCIYCSRLKFDERIEGKLGKKQVDSLAVWMRAQPAFPGQKMSTFEYLLPEDQRGLSEFGIQYPYRIDESQAVEFVRVNSLGADVTGILSGTIDGIKSTFGLDQNDDAPSRTSRLFILNSKDVLYPYGRTGPSAFMSEEARKANKPMQCIQQIR